MSDEQKNAMIPVMDNAITTIVQEIKCDAIADVRNSLEKSIQSCRWVVFQGRVDGDRILLERTVQGFPMAEVDNLLKLIAADCVKLKSVAQPDQ